MNIKTKVVSASSVGYQFDLLSGALVQVHLSENTETHSVHILTTEPMKERVLRHKKCVDSVSVCPLFKLIGLRLKITHACREDDERGERKMIENIRL